MLIILYSSLVYSITKDKIMVFEMWCLRRILKISWQERTANEEVLRMIEKRNLLAESEEGNTVCRALQEQNKMFLEAK